MSDSNELHDHNSTQTLAESEHQSPPGPAPDQTAPDPAAETATSNADAPEQSGVDGPIEADQAASNAPPEDPVDSDQGAVADGTSSADFSEPPEAADATSPADAPSSADVTPAETPAAETSAAETSAAESPSEAGDRPAEWWTAPGATEPAPAAKESADTETDAFPVEAGVSQDFDHTWQRIEDDFTQKRTLTALVVDRVKGGLVVDIGVQGFVPASQVSPGRIHDLERFVGASIKLRITDLDRERQRVVLSARAVAEEEHALRKRETMEKLKVGLVAEGVVRRLTDFGAFVDIGGVDGLLHVSEMSWSRIKHPKEAVSPGDHVKVKVLKISDDRRKISLGMRQLLPDPWNGLQQHYKVGDLVSGRVARVAAFGAFVLIKDGVEAMLPNSEVSSRKPRPEDLPQVGDTVSAKIVELKPELRQMRLSVRKIQEDDDRREYNQHVQQRETGSRTTIGDMFGHILSDWKEDRNQADEEGK